MTEKKSLKEFANEERDERAFAQLVQDRANLQRKVTQQNSTITQLTEERNHLKSTLDLLSRLEDAKSEPPEWLRPPKSTKTHRATACFQMTDTHYDEVVNPETIDFINKYDRDIALLRTQRFFERGIMVSRDYLSGIEYDGFTLFMTGDIFSGIIHDELKETNSHTLFESILFWVEHIEAGINMMADEFGKGHVVVVPGNHGRTTKKPKHKRSAQENIDWLLGKLIERDFRNDDRVTFQVPPSRDALVSVYETKYLATHGDQFHGGSGISGAMAPLLLGTHRKSRRNLTAGRPYDIMVLGHFHQYLGWPAKGIMMGGCLKGYDEFAFNGNFEPEPPQQAFWITTPEHGMTIHAPIFVGSRSAEGW